MRILNNTGEFGEFELGKKIIIQNYLHAQIKKNTLSDRYDLGKGEIVWVRKKWPFDLGVIESFKFWKWSTIDAFELSEGYAHYIFSTFKIGDTVSEIFKPNTDIPKLNADFVEIASGSLFFIFSNKFAFSVKYSGTDIEDGPYSESEWKEVLGARISTVSFYDYNFSSYAY